MLIVHVWVEGNEWIEGNETWDSRFKSRDPVVRIWIGGRETGDQTKQGVE